MKRTDLLIVATVVATVVVVARLRTSQERGTRAATPAAPAGTVEASPSQPPVAGALPRMVDLGAGHCVPCRKMAPILARLRSEYTGRAEVVFIDVWEQPDLADGYSFRAIPTQIFYDREGREAWRHEGFLDEPEIVAQFGHLGVQ